MEDNFCGPQTCTRRGDSWRRRVSGTLDPSYSLTRLCLRPSPARQYRVIIIVTLLVTLPQGVLLKDIPEIHGPLPSNPWPRRQGLDSGPLATARGNFAGNVAGKDPSEADPSRQSRSSDWEVSHLPRLSKLETLSDEGLPRSGRRKSMRFLGQRIRSARLASLDLSLHQHQEALDSAGQPLPKLTCQGRACPDLEDCDGDVIKACHLPAFVDSGAPPGGVWEKNSNSPECPDEGDLSGIRLFLPHCKVARGDRLAARWQAQVVVLKNVFVNANGDVFNATHKFFLGGCAHHGSLHPQFSYSNSTEIREFSEVVNFAIGPRGGHSAYEMLERLPLFLIMAPFLPELVGRAPFYFGERKGLSRTLDSILGVFPAKHAIKALGPDELIFAHTLYQPMHQPCNVPSPSLWAYLRHAYLLTPSPPIFNPDWTLTRKLPQQPIDAARSGVGLLPDWRVIFAQPPHAVPLVIETHYNNIYYEPITAEQMITSDFWWDNFARFSTSWDRHESKLLFNRAAFFISTPGPVITQMLLMPPGSVVLLVDRAQKLRPDAARKYNSGLTGHLRAAAAATGLVLTTLICPSSLDGTNGIVCIGDRFAEALSWAADQVFQSGILPESKEWEAASGLLPGTGLKSPQEVDSFRSWAQCVSQKGSWVMDTTPRLLPWPYHGFLQQCDTHHVYKGLGNVAGHHADEIASNPRANPASWRVRDTAKYVWEVRPEACPAPSAGATDSSWVSFDRDEICRRRGEHKLRVLILGDSLQDQFIEAIAQNILIGQSNLTQAFHFHIPHDCEDWVGDATVLHSYCRIGVFSHHVCPGLHLEFIRNDHLEVHPHGKPRFDNMPWTQFLKPHLDRADVIIINRGPHYTPMPGFLRGLKAAARLLRRWYPDKLLVYRNTPPGHLNCTEHFRPLTRRQDPSSLPYNWGEFQEQNKAAKSIVEELGFLYMDVDTMTGLRADGHKGARDWPFGASTVKVDCLHYCSPGPVDTWAQLFFNLLRHLKLDKW